MRQLIDDYYVTKLRRIQIVQSMQCLSSKMVDSLIYHIENASKLSSNQCRVLIINSDRNSNTFCSGHNLKELLSAIIDQNEQEWKHHFEMCSELLLTIQSSLIPTISCLDGVVTASGLEIASVTDMTLCTKDTKFCIPGMNIGVNACKPATTFSNSLNHNNWKLGLEMLFTGKETMIDSIMAYNRGYINYIAEDYDDMNAKVLEYGNKIASKSRLCITMGKETFYEQMRYKKDVIKAYGICSKTMVDNMLTYDVCEGIQAFLNKTTPNWKDTVMFLY